MTSNETTNNEERRTLRQKYRDLSEEVLREKEELIKPDNEALTDKVKQCNNLFDQVREIPEAVLDAQVMNMAATFGLQKAAQMQTDLIAFKPEDFMEKLITKMNGTLVDEQNDVVDISDEGWCSLIPNRAKYMSVIPTLCPMLGVCNIGPKIKVRKEHMKNTQSSEKSQPTHITNYKNDGKEATPEEIERVLSIVQKIYRQHGCPIDYFELVVNPSSYGHTIENIFHLSFLVKDGFIRIMLNDEGLPVVEPVEKVQNGQGNISNKKSNQVMISLSMEDWREIIDVYELKNKQPYIRVRGEK